METLTNLIPCAVALVIAYFFPDGIRDMIRRIKAERRYTALLQSEHVVSELKALAGEQQGPIEQSDIMRKKLAEVAAQLSQYDRRLIVSALYQDSISARARYALRALRRAGVVAADPQSECRSSVTR